MAKAASAVPQGFQTMTPQLTLDNAAQSMGLKKAFGAEEMVRSCRARRQDHACRLENGNARFFVNDVMMGKGPLGFGGSPAFWLYVENSDAFFEHAVGAGATVQMPMADQFWGDRAGLIADPAGYSWWIATRKEDLTTEEIQQRAAEFFRQMGESAGS